MDGFGVDRVECRWCGALNLPREEDVFPCYRCKLSVVKSSTLLNGAGGKSSKKPSVPGGKDRLKAPKISPFKTELSGFPVVGVDPGARYTGVVVRDEDTPLLSSTLVRPAEMNGPDWAVMVVDELSEILSSHGWEDIPMGIEGISDPKGFHKGKRAALNPKDIIRAGMVVGAVYSCWRHAYIIPPGGNGSQHISHYPDALRGRRPKGLLGSAVGAKTRGHEQSAYDVAGKLLVILKREKKLPN